MGCFYGFMMYVLKVIGFLFFRRIEVSGAASIPEEGAVIFAGNHPNALIDPGLIMISTTREVKTMAKSTLFKGPLGMIVRGLGGIPVFRQMDESAGEARRSNEDAFREVHACLENGGAFSIFPEGISHTESMLQDLKQGLSRMALNFLTGTRERTGRLPPLTIIPVGFTYLNRHEFRSRVWVKFGTGFRVPLAIVEEYASGDKERQRQAAHDLTDLVAAALRRYTITAPDWETVELITLSTSMFRASPAGGHATKPYLCWCCAVDDSYEIPLQNQLHMASIFRQGAVMLRDDPVMMTLRVKVAAYSDILKALRLTDDDVRIHRELSCAEVFFSSLFYFLVIIIGLPLSLPIAILNAPIVVPALIIANKLAGSELDVIATFKVLISFLLLPIIYSVYIGVLSWLCATQFTTLMSLTNHLNVGAYVAIFFVLIPLTGLIALYIWEQVLFAKDHCLRLGYLLRYASTMQTAVALRAECHTILHAVFALVRPPAVLEEALAVYPHTPFLAKHEAEAAIVAFVERNKIDAADSILTQTSLASTLRASAAAATASAGEVAVEDVHSSTNYDGTVDGDIEMLRRSFQGGGAATDALVRQTSLRASKQLKAQAAGPAEVRRQHSTALLSSSSVFFGAAAGAPDEGRDAAVDVAPPPAPAAATSTATAGLFSTTASATAIAGPPPFSGGGGGATSCSVFIDNDDDRVVELDASSGAALLPTNTTNTTNNNNNTGREASIVFGSGGGGSASFAASSARRPTVHRLGSGVLTRGDTDADIQRQDSLAERHNVFAFWRREERRGEDGKAAAAPKEPLAADTKGTPQAAATGVEESRHVDSPHRDASHSIPREPVGADAGADEDNTQPQQSTPTTVSSSPAAAATRNAPPLDRLPPQPEPADGDDDDRA